MRTDIIGLGVVLAVGGLIYGSSRIAGRGTDPPAVASIEASPAREGERASRVRARRQASRHAAAAIAAHVREAAARNELPESLVAAVISVESEFNPRAVSRRGALGLMQLMPSTAAMLGVRDAFDPGQNIHAGARHLRDLIDRFSGDVTLALAAYNAGPQNVLKHKGVPPYPETRNFVARVLARAGMMATPAVASSHARPVASAVSAAVVTPAAAPAGTPPRAQWLRNAAEPARRTTSEVTFAPAAFAESRQAPSAPPAPVGAPVVAAPEVSAAEPLPVVSSEAP